MTVYKSENDVFEQTSAEQKIKSMVACKDFRKGIIQLQWEHKKMQMEMEDLNNKSRDIRRLKLNEEQRDVSVIRLQWNPLGFWQLTSAALDHFTHKSQQMDNGGFCLLYIASTSEVFWIEHDLE